MSIQVQHRRDSRTNCEANTPAEGELWYDTTLKALRAGTGAVLGGVLQKMWGRCYAISPPQIAADQHDYAPADLAIAETVFASSDAARAITGLAGGGAHRRLTLCNAGAHNITLADASAPSTAANRFAFGEDVVLRAGGSVDLQYSTADNRWHRASGGLKVATIPEELLLPGAISPPQIAADQHDYAPAGLVAASTLRLSTDAIRNITGLVDPRDGAIKAIVNVGANDLVLKNADAGSTAANRFDFGADVTLAGKQSCTIRYDATDGRWKLLASTAGGAVAAGAVTANKLAGSAIGARAGMINGKLVESRAGNAVTYAVKTLAGVDPTALDPVRFTFQDGSGGYVTRDVTAALSLTISSGSTLGADNGVPFRVWLLAVDTGAGVVLGAVKASDASGVMALCEAMPISTTAEGGAGAADLVKTVYTAAAQASKAFALIGFADYDNGLAAAGAWSVAPSAIRLFTPGTPRPGEVVQTVTMVQSSTSTTTSTSFTDTSTVVTLTPVSACNAVRISASGNLRAAAGAAIAMASLHNGSTAIGSVGAAYGGGGLASVGVALDAFDLPGTTAALTYMVKIKLDSAGTGYWGVSGGCQIEACEIMG